jgi:hypothetical protein
VYWIEVEPKKGRAEVEMKKLNATALAAMALWASLLSSAEASALLIEKTEDPRSDPLELTFFYPYPTSYASIDPGYAFDDDPMSALVDEPFTMPIVVERITVRRSMVQVRRSFVEEMYRSTDAI